MLLMHFYQYLWPFIRLHLNLLLLPFGPSFDETYIDFRQLKKMCAMPSLMNMARIPVGFFLNISSMYMLFQFFTLSEKGHRRSFEQI